LHVFAIAFELVGEEGFFVFGAGREQEGEDECVRAVGDDLLFVLHFDDARGVGVDFVDEEDDDEGGRHDDLRGNGGPGGNVRPAEASVEAWQE